MVSERNSLVNTRGRRYIVYLLWAATVAVPLWPLGGDICLVLALLLSLWFDHDRLGKNLGCLQCLLIGFILWSGLSLVNSPRIGFSGLTWIYNVGLYGVMYFLMYAYMDREDDQATTLRLFVWTAVIVCLIGAYQYVYVVATQVNEWVDAVHFPKLMRRMYSTLMNPNLLGEYLLMVIAITGTGILQGLKSRRFHLLSWLVPITLAFLICLVLTYSRGIWVSLAVVVLYWGITIDRRLLFCLLAIPLVLWFYHGEVSSRLWSLFSGQDTSVMLRWALWDSTTYMIMDHPILGIGWDSYWMVYPHYNYFIQDPEVIIYHAHNMFLNVLAEIGIPGALCYFGAMLAHPWAMFKIKSERFGMTLQYGLGAVIVGILVSGLFDFTLFSHQVSLVYFGLLGLGAAMVANQRK